MSETLSRRNILVTIATAAAVGASVTEAEAQHVHEAVAEDTKGAPGTYKPKAFTEHETKTLRLLCETIVPGASQGGAFEYIDLLSSNNLELKTIYSGGLSWLDRKTQSRVGATFVDAKPEERKALL